MASNTQQRALAEPMPAAQRAPDGQRASGPARRELLELERRARAEITALYRLTDAANRAETLEQVFEAALDGIASALAVERAAILLVDSDGVMRFKAWRGLSDGYRAAVEGHTPWRPDDRDPAPVVVEDVRTDPALESYRPVFERERVGALAFFPLLSRGRIKGKFMVYHPGPHRFTDDEQRLARAVADQIAFAVSRMLSMQERERLVGIVGHDLRNPLSAVTVSAAALLRHDDLSAGAGKLVRRIATSAERMEGLIAQLLDFAQARQGAEFPLRRGLTDLAEVARRVVDELEAAHPESKLLLSVDGAPVGNWDAERLAQVLSNLVANAIQHGDGAVDVRLRVDGGEAVVEVHNAGAPIPATMLPDLFDPFTRGRGSGARSGGSLGLGLFISREIVRAHGGSIQVRSSERDGTTFAVRLPREPLR